jgi:hypothetical protein
MKKLSLSLSAVALLLTFACAHTATAPDCLHNGSLLQASEAQVLACAGEPCEKLSVEGFPAALDWHYCEGECRRGCEKETLVRIQDGTVTAIQSQVPTYRPPKP